MTELSVNGFHLLMYDSIDELPIINFQKYNKYLLIDSGIGSDIESIDRHLTTLAKLIKTDKVKATQELQNLRINMHYIVSNISPKYFAFTALIHSINGKKLEDLSDTNLKNIINKINTVKRSKIISFLENIKKKLSTELQTYFPSDFEGDAKEKEVYDKRKQRVLYKLEELVENKDNSKAIQDIDDFLFCLYKPLSFNGQKSVEVLYDKQFESACVYIGQEMHVDAKKMTTLAFYAAFHELKKQAEAKLKAYKSIKTR